MRLGVYSDYSYQLVDGALLAELPFARFVMGLATHTERLVVTGRLDTGAERYRYRMDGVYYVPLPNYTSGAHLREVVLALPGGVRRFWRLLDTVDVAWILGPNPPQTLVFALLTILRRRRLVLGVRQLLPELIRHRHPDRPVVKVAAVVLEGAYRMLSRVVPVVVVGPDLARHYRHARDRQVILVSMLHERDLVAAGAVKRSWDSQTELRILSVGRLDPEKNPLLLADVLARARQNDPRWHLDVCGDGPMERALARRVAELGLEQHVTLHGHVPIDGGLWELYHQSHVLLHVSFTEGVPQVVLEAFAARLPVVATGVGGVPDVVGSRGWVIPPGDAEAAAQALAEVLAAPDVREERVARGAAFARRHTLERETYELAAFLAGAEGAASPSDGLNTRSSEGASAAASR